MVMARIPLAAPQTLARPPSLHSLNHTRGNTRRPPRPRLPRSPRACIRHTVAYHTPIAESSAPSATFVRHQHHAATPQRLHCLIDPRRLVRCPLGSRQPSRTRRRPPTHLASLQPVVVSLRFVSLRFVSLRFVRSCLVCSPMPPLRTADDIHAGCPVASRSLLPRRQRTTSAVAPPPRELPVTLTH